jgi:hypothetical protein
MKDGFVKVIVVDPAVRPLRARGKDSERSRWHREAFTVVRDTA